MQTPLNEGPFKSPTPAQWSPWEWACSCVVEVQILGLQLPWAFDLLSNSNVVKEVDVPYEVAVLPEGCKPTFGQM